MAQIVTITNPLTGQPVQVDQLEHTAQQIDDIVNASGIESIDYPGCYYRMVGGVVEWLNPPLQLGQEYRTTERFNGKPVYVKMVDFGALPNKTQKRVSIGVTIKDSVSCEMSFGKSGIYNHTVPFYGGADIGGISVMAHISVESVLCGTTADYSEFNAIALCKYTKTTD